MPLGLKLILKSQLNYSKIYKLFKNKIALVSSFKYQINLLYFWVLLFAASSALRQTAGVSTPRYKLGISFNLQTL